MLKKIWAAVCLLLIFSACKNVRKHKNVGDPVAAAELKLVYLDTLEQSCRGAALRLVLSSAKVKTLLAALDETVKKNGGSGHGFILDASPNPNRDEAEKSSDMYEFSVHEIYPTMHPPVAQYSYHPVKQDLYILDPTQNKNTLIDFDRTLVNSVTTACQ